MARRSTTKKPRKKKTVPASKRRKSDPSPSEEQWLSWRPMKFCTVKDPRNNDDNVTFYLGENILILNYAWQSTKDYDPWEFWVGRIEAIRGDGPKNTWAKIQWYHSGTDIAESVPDMDTSSYGRYERSLGPELEMISIQSINGRAVVIEYDETSLDQKPIPPDSFYTRRRFDSREGVIPPIVVDTSTCFCQQPYNPDALDPMHLCPRCKRWYHESCLVDNDHTSDRPADQRMQDFLDVPADWESHIPFELHQLACVPIIRGGPTHGVVGNVKAVSEAREWARLYARRPWSVNLPVPQLKGITLDRWLDSLEGVKFEELIYPGDEGCGNSFFAWMNICDEEPPFECPSCGKSI